VILPSECRALGEGAITTYFIRPILFKGEIITNMQKWGGVIEKSSQEPLSQKSSYFHENFLI
jgi:hypothetical protein